MRRLGEDDEQVGRDLRDQLGPRRCRARGGEKGRGGAEQVRRVADRERVRAIGCEQRDQAGASDPQGGKGAGVAEDRGQEGRGGDATLLMDDDRGILALREARDQPLDIDGVLPVLPLEEAARPAWSRQP